MNIFNGKFHQLEYRNQFIKIIHKNFSFQSVSILNPVAFKESKNIN